MSEQRQRIIADMTSEKTEWVKFRGEDYISYNPGWDEHGDPIVDIRVRDYRSASRSVRGQIGELITMDYLTLHNISAERQPHDSPFDILTEDGEKIESKTTMAHTDKIRWTICLGGGENNHNDDAIQLGNRWIRDYRTICDYLMCVCLHEDGSSDLFMIPSNAAEIDLETNSFEIPYHWQRSRFAAYHVDWN